jgi:AraC family transcriptional regulator
MGQGSKPANISDPIWSMETGGFLLTERVHPANWTLPKHEHQSMIIGVVYQGLYKETICEHSRECGPHSIQLLPAGETHTYEFGRARVRCLTIDIKPQMLETIRQFSRLPDYPMHISSGILSLLVTRLYGEFRLRDNTSILTVEGLVLETLGNATHLSDRGSPTMRPRWLHQAKDFIHENSLKGVSLISVAAAVGVTPAYLARAFRKFFRCSVGEYVRRLRLEYAARELANTNKPLAEIAVDSGFYDQSHMTHAFKLNLRMTPAEWRAATQAGHASTKGLRFSKTA